MDDSRDLVAEHPELQGLPISQLMMRRLMDITDDENNFEAEDAIAPIVAAIASLERELKGG